MDATRSNPWRWSPWSLKLTAIVMLSELSDKPRVWNTIERWSRDQNLLQLWRKKPKSSEIKALTTTITQLQREAVVCSVEHISDMSNGTPQWRILFQFWFPWWYKIGKDVKQTSDRETRSVKRRCKTNIRSRKVNLIWVQITHNLSKYSIEPIFYNVGEWNGLSKEIATSSVLIKAIPSYFRNVWTV